MNWDFNHKDTKTQKKLLCLFKPEPTDRHIQNATRLILASDMRCDGVLIEIGESFMCLLRKGHQVARS